MHLPIADHIRPTRTGKRLAAREPTGLGLYTDQTYAAVSKESRYREIWRSEVRIGVNTAVNPLDHQDKIARVHQDTKGLIMRHLYGPFYNELGELMREFYEQGIHRGNPAFDRVSKMLETLSDAFKGDI